MTECLFGQKIMNWYNNLKFSQIWQTKSKDTFKGLLLSLYELEYKRFMLVNKPFKGLPERQDNMIKKQKKNYIR